MGSILSRIPPEMLLKLYPIYQFYVKHKTQFKIGSVAAILIWISILYRKRSGKRRGLPPGPTPLPIIGNLLQIGGDVLPLFYQKMMRIHGNIITIWLSGGSPLIVIGDAAALREAFVTHGDKLSRRPPAPWIMKYEQLGSSMLHGNERPAVWRRLRRTCLTAMRDFGVGKQSMEDQIHVELQWLIGRLEQHGATALNQRELLFSAVTNVIAYVCFGHRFEHGHAQFEQVKKNLNIFFNNILINYRWVNFFPPLRLFPYSQGLKDSIKIIRDIFDFIRDEVKQHRKDFDANNLRDMIDTYLKHEESGRHKDNDDALSEDEILRLILDVFVAGTDTTTTSLRFALLYAAAYPHLQRRCQHEIDRVLGRKRLPRMADRANLPFVDAFVHEAMRLGSVTAVTLPHFSYGHDVTINGYRIPKNTTVLAGIHRIHTDETAFPNPNEFNPDRWLDADGALKHSESFLPFGLGPRMCAGEKLAKMEIYIFFIGLLQNFTMKAVGSLDLVANNNITRTPKPYELIAVKRD